jgi:hypothetical protein
MRTLRIALLLLVAVTAFTSCKRRGGGYMQTPPAPVATP